MVMEGKQFLKEIKMEEAICFSLLPIPNSKEKPTADDKAEGKDKDLNLEVKEIIDKSKGIVVEGVQRSLLPMREISHYIELITGATLPNKPIQTHTTTK